MFVRIQISFISIIFGALRQYFSFISRNRKLPEHLLPMGLWICPPENVKLQNLIIGVLPQIYFKLATSRRHSRKSVHLERNHSSILQRREWSTAARQLRPDEGSMLILSGVVPPHLFARLKGGRPRLQHLKQPVSVSPPPTTRAATSNSSQRPSHIKDGPGHWELWNIRRYYHEFQ